MKHIQNKLLAILSAGVIFSTNSVAQERSFSIGAGPAFDNYGYVDDNDKITSTWYIGPTLTADWLFAPHFGLKMDVGSLWSFSTNITGVRERPMHSIANLSLAVAPYYEFNLHKWFIDLGLVAGCRIRLPYMNGELSKYIMTLSAGAGAGARFGYQINDRFSAFCDLSAQMTVYDLLYRTACPDKSPNSGNVHSSVGVRYSICSY